MRFKMIGVAAALLLVASLAPAGVKAQSMETGVNWTGCYVGLNAGAEWANTKFQWTNINEGTAFAVGAATVLPNAANTTFNQTGFLGGGQAGCNWQVNPMWVWGIEGDFDGSSLSSSRSAISLGNTNGGPATIAPGNIRESMSSDWFSTARVRAGVTPFRPDLLLYGTGGVAITNVKLFDQVCFPTALVPTCNTAPYDGTRFGWTMGAGAEWMINPTWSVKLEYLYADFGNIGTSSQPLTIAAPQINPNPGAIITHVHRLDDNIVRVGFNFHFATPPAPAAMPAPPPAAPRVFIVFFDWDKDVITPEGHAIIQQAADAYKSGAPVQLQVTGYTDRSGSPGYNQRLSERRANNVARAMAALGVPKNEMVVSGRGENDNRVPTAPGVREPQNRRVEIVAP